jgi:hypothetical protein
VGVDDWEHMVPWLRRAVESAPDQSSEALLGSLIESLRRELTSVYPSTPFKVDRLGEAVLIEWSGEPPHSELADRINVDPTYEHSSGLEVGRLWGEDLPEALATVAVLLRHRP